VILYIFVLCKNIHKMSLFPVYKTLLLVLCLYQTSCDMSTRFKLEDVRFCYFVFHRPQLHHIGHGTAWYSAAQRGMILSLMTVTLRRTYIIGHFPRVSGSWHETVLSFACHISQTQQKLHLKQTSDSNSLLDTRSPVSEYAGICKYTVRGIKFANVRLNTGPRTWILALKTRARAID